MQAERISTAAVARAEEAVQRSPLLWGASTSSERRLEVLGLACENVTLAAAAASLVAAARQRLATRVVFVNAHVVNCAQADRSYRETVETADRRYADGSGMAVAARLTRQRFVDNVNGTDLFPLLCAEAVRQGVTVYLLGGVPGAAAGSAAAMAQAGCGHAIAGTHHGYFVHSSAEEERIIAAINASGASILLVGLGVPVQDEWLARNQHRLSVPVIAGVGGLFDFYSGRMTRAPHLLRAIGMEWSWRLAMEPGRMWRRYLIGNVTFMMHAVRDARRAGRGARAPAVAAMRVES